MNFKEIAFIRLREVKGGIARGDLMHFKRKKDYSLGKASLWRRAQVWWETGGKESRVLSRVRL